MQVSVHYISSSMGAGADVQGSFPPVCTALGSDCNEEAYQEWSQLYETKRLSAPREPCGIPPDWLFQRRRRKKEACQRGTPKRTLREPVSRGHDSRERQQISPHTAGRVVLPSSRPHDDALFQVSGGPLTFFMAKSTTQEAEIFHLGQSLNAAGVGYQLDFTPAVADGTMAVRWARWEPEL